MARRRDRTVQEWLVEINRGLEYRKRYGLENSWHELEGLFYQVSGTQANSGPNIVLSTGDALMSALNVPDPYITVKARRSDFVEQARIVESTDNMLVESMGLRAEIERATLCAYLWGRGILKIGYDSEFGWDENLDIGLGQAIGMTVTMYDRDGKLIEYGKTQPGMPWARCVLPHDIVVPWGTYDFDDAPWVAHRVVRHYQHVRRDIKYENNKQVQPYLSMQDVVKSYQTSMKPYRVGTSTYNWQSHSSGDSEYVELWEIRDRETGRIYVITHTTEKYLRNQTDRLQDGGLPFVGVSFTPRARTFWTTSDAFNLKYHQAELSDISIQSSKQRRANVLKFIYDAEALDEEEVNKAVSGRVGVGIRKKTGFSAAEAFMPLNPGQPNLGLMQDAEVTRRNAREQVGFSRNQIGEFETSGRRTATEASIVNEASGLRMDRRQTAIANLYVSVFRKVNPIIFDNWKLPRIVEIVGENGLPRWMKVTGDDIRGDYALNVGFSTGGKETLQARRSFALQILMAGLQNPIFDPAQLARFVANSFNDPEFSSIFKEGLLDGQGQMQGGGQGQMGAGPAGTLAPSAGQGLALT